MNCESQQKRWTGKVLTADLKQSWWKKEAEKKEKTGRYKVEMKLSSLLQKQCETQSEGEEQI